MDHRVPNPNSVLARQQTHRKRSFPGINPRKRDRHDLICVVCHAPAMGYNFDQITCESCKAFFRRNALNNADKFKCRSNTNDCLITLDTRKRCKACRLKKCFEKGLRKEWIMSEEEKQTKRQKIEDNRRLRALSQNVAISSVRSFTPTSSPSIVPENENFPYTTENSTNLNENDDELDPFDCQSDETTRDDCVREKSDEKGLDYKIFLNNDDRRHLTIVEDNYYQAIRLYTPIIKGHDAPCLRNLSKPIDLINELFHMSTLRMITFLKLTPEFQSLQEDDRLALVKNNLLAIFYLHFSICTNLHNDIYQEPRLNNEFCYHASDLGLISSEIYQEARSFVEEIQQLSAMDHTIIKLIILIVIFSKTSDHDPIVWVESQKIFRAQNVYVKLLWNYLHVRFGSEQTPSKYSRLIFSCLKAQNLGRKTKEIVHEQIVNNQQLAPLMQSILFLS